MLIVVPSGIEYWMTERVEYRGDLLFTVELCYLNILPCAVKENQITVVKDDPSEMEIMRKLQHVRTRRALRD